MLDVPACVENGSLPRSFAFFGGVAPDRPQGSPGAAEAADVEGEAEEQRGEEADRDPDRGPFDDKADCTGAQHSCRLFTWVSDSEI